MPGSTNAAAGLIGRLRSLLRRCTVRNERMRLCETLSLGGRRSAALIQCDGRHFLVGMSSTAVQTVVPVGAAGAETGECA